MELLLRSTETHHQEEKLRLQREYEESIQQVTYVIITLLYQWESGDQ